MPRIGTTPDGTAIFDDTVGATSPQRNAIIADAVQSGADVSRPGQEYSGRPDGTGSTAGLNFDGLDTKKPDSPSLNFDGLDAKKADSPSLNFDGVGQKETGLSFQGIADTIMTPGYQQMGRDIKDNPDAAAAGAAGSVIGGIPAFLGMFADLMPSAYVGRMLTGQMDNKNPLAIVKQRAAAIGDWGNKFAASFEKDPAAIQANPGFEAGGRAAGQVMFPPGEAITMGSDEVRKRYGEIAGDLADLGGNIAGMLVGGVRVPGTGRGVKVPPADRVNESAQRAKDAEDKYKSEANKQPIEGEFKRVDDIDPNAPRLPAPGPPPDGGPPAKAPKLQNQTKLEAEAKAKAAENLQKLQEHDPATVEEAAKVADQAATARGEQGAVTEGQRAVQVQETRAVADAIEVRKQEEAKIANDRIEEIELKPIADYPEVPLPPVPEGHTRMYRGGDTGKFSDEVGRERQNREFTTDRSVATSYGEPSYVDVPHAIAESSKIGPDHYVLPKEHAGRAVKEPAFVAEPKPIYMDDATWSMVQEGRKAREEWVKDNPAPKSDIERWC